MTISVSWRGRRAARSKSPQPPFLNSAYPTSFAGHGGGEWEIWIPSWGHKAWGFYRAHLTPVSSRRLMGKGEFFWLPPFVKGDGGGFLIFPHLN